MYRLPPPTVAPFQTVSKGFVGLLGNPHALGEAIHITSDEVLTWNQIFEIVADAAGVAPQIVHMPSERIAAYDARWGAGLLGDKAHSMVFDNTKIKRFVPDFAATIPLSWGAREIMTWYDADPARQTVNDEFNRLTNTIIEAQQRAMPAAQEENS